MRDSIVHKPSICVIIAARDAVETIGSAIGSALAEQEVAEVILVDDASGDGTSEAAHKAADGDPRLLILRQDVNIGPAAARNAAIAASSSPLLAVLDGDDVILPGRFAAMLAGFEGDMVADNILFAAEDAAGTLPVPESPVVARPVTQLSLREFVQGNISDGGAQRGELGFLKPLMRREFLREHGLSYDGRLRLGEDFDLYTRALLAGARFSVSRQVGYLARVRSNSLSARHKTADLQALLAACDRHIAAAKADDLPVLQRHRHQCRNRYLLRAFLDAKSEGGMRAALQMALDPPANLAPIARGVLRDKLAAMRPKAEASPVGRTLLPL